MDVVHVCVLVQWRAGTVRLCGVPEREVWHPPPAWRKAVRNGQLMDVVVCVCMYVCDGVHMYV